VRLEPWAVGGVCRRLVATGRAALIVPTLALSLCTALVVLGVLPRAALAVAGVATGHGALLATALGWADFAGRAGPRTVTDSLLIVGLLALAAAAAQMAPWGAAAYLVVPLWLARRARRDGLARLGLPGPIRIRPLVLGLALGSALGAHLLLSSTRTLGYRVRTDDLGGYLAALAYDVGANVPSSELFFRGALFNAAQRLSGFPPAAALATGASLVRYVIDPLLPKAPEVLLGTLFYVTLLGVANAWLLWWSGSLLPGLLSALVFFAVYRLLAMA
jgi:hypothetical protein